MEVGLLEKINICLTKEEIEILIDVLNYADFEYGIDDLPEEELKEKLSVLIEN